MNEQPGLREENRYLRRLLAVCVLRLGGRVVISEDDGELSEATVGILDIGNGDVELRAG